MQYTPVKISLSQVTLNWFARQKYTLSNLNGKTSLLQT